MSGRKTVTRPWRIERLGYGGWYCLTTVTTRDRAEQELAWYRGHHYGPLRAHNRETGEVIADNLMRDEAAKMLPVAVKAVTDRVRELHIEQFWNVRDEVWRTNPRCDECGHAYPCPTVRLLDQIDAEMGGE